MTVTVAVLLTVSLLLVSVAAQTTQVCPLAPQWLLFEEKCYHFVSYPKLAYQAASASCQNNGATLISVNNAREHRFVTRWLERNDGGRNTWMTSGVTSRAFGIQWKGDGTRSQDLDYWVDDQFKNTDNLNVVYLFDNTEYGWGVGSSLRGLSYICEINVDESYRILQEIRDFDYGLDIDMPSLAPRGPRFMVQPTDTIILSDRVEAVFLDCLASGLPDVEYSWTMMQGNTMVPVPIGNDKYALTSGKLTISNPDRNDEKDYQCSASNTFGTILSSPITLSFGDMGEFSSVAADDVTGYEFDGAVLECPTITAKPAIRYQWFKNSYLTFIRPNFQKHSFISSNGKLYFSELATSDQGMYFCVASLSSLGITGNYEGASQAASKTSLGFMLNVVSRGGSEYQPVIQNDFINVFPGVPRRGQTIYLECFAYGTGPLHYSWRREDNKRLPNGYSLRSNNRILVLPDVQLEDGGRYICRVESSKTNLNDEKSYDLNIETKPYFTFPLRNQHMDKGAPLTWHCEAMGQPIPTYTWYKNGQQLTDTEDLHILRNTLTIDSVKADVHIGMYQCKATNIHGSTYSSAQLRVVEVKPSFKKYPLEKSIMAAVNGDVTIVCQPEAAPIPTFSWKRNGMDLGLTAGQGGDSDHYSLLLNGNLLIRNVQMSDQAIFTCVAENKLGSAEDTASVFVQDKIRISLRPVQVTVDVNLTATMQCQASYPKSADMVYTWKFFDHVIDVDKEPEYRLGTGVTKGYLYVIGAQYRNEGKYTCVANTVMDSDSASEQLTVLGPPGEPAGVRFTDLTLGTGDQPEATTGNSRWIVWSDGPNHGAPITHYYIEFRTKYDMAWRTHPDGNLVPEYLTIIDLFPNNKFRLMTNLKAFVGIQFRVRAVNMYGVGAPSLPTSMVQMPGAKPTVKVQGISGGGGSVGDLTIIWQPLAREDYNGNDLAYRVYWRTKESGSRSDAKWEIKNVTLDNSCKMRYDFATGLVLMCQFVTLVGKNNYYLPYEVAVVASNEHGDGPFPDIVTVMSAEEMPKGTPEKVFAGTYNSTALLVTWEPVKNDRINVGGRLKGYKINYWRRDFETETMARQNIIQLKPGQENLDHGLIIGLQSVTWYVVNVQVYNTAGNGAKSSNYEQQTLNRIPSQYPTEVHVHSMDGFKVRVNFRGISTQVREEPLQGYMLQYWRLSENILSASAIDVGKSSGGIISNLTKNTVYQLRVYGYSRGGQGKRSSPMVYFTVGDGQVAINPETMEIMNGSSTLYPSIILSFITVFFAVLRHLCTQSLP